MKAFFPEPSHVAFDAPTTPRRIAFSAPFRDMVSRASFGSDAIQQATLEEVRSALLLASETLPVIDFERAARIYAHNPRCFVLVRNADFAKSAMMAYLPLNAKGAAALIDGRFDGLDPKLNWICEPAEAPEAIYLWLVYTPAKMVSGLRLVQELERLGKGVPLFTRPAHQASARILARSGFLPAQGLFPSAPDWLIVALPEASDADGSSAPDVLVRVARTLDDIMKVFSIRTATYMAEQSASYSEEFDGNDFCATHLIAEVDGEPAACVRIRFFADFAKLERLAVRPEHRRSRLMFAIVRASFDHCRKKGYRKLYAHAREDLVPAWERFGARLMEDRPPFRFSDIVFREMWLDVEPAEDAVLFGSDPMITIRPEGEWDRLGPLDRAQFYSPPGRRETIESQLRQLRSQ